MPTFVSLINWTEQGINNFRDTSQRANAFRELVEKKGGRVVSIYWTLGEYDIVAVTEVPDDETFAALGLIVGSQGNVRTTTLRAFDEDEIERIIQKTG
jgi:uncharacterized protein with GYD domain